MASTPEPALLQPGRDAGAANLQTTEGMKEQTTHVQGGLLPDGIARASSATGPQASVVRKKLPWLEKQPLWQRLALTPQQPERVDKSCRPFLGGIGNHTEASIQTLESDPALRAIDSTPSLRQQRHKEDTSTYSQASQLTPESRCMPTYEKRPALSSFPKVTAVASDYSVADFGRGKPAAGVFPKTRSGEPERPIAARTADRDGASKTPNWAQDNHGLPIQDPRDTACGSGTARSRGAKTQVPKPSLCRRWVKDQPSTRRLERCKSCDDRIVFQKVGHVRVRPQHERMERASHEESMYEPSPFRPLPTKPSTLYSLPVHLMASSGPSSSEHSQHINISDSSASTTLRTRNNFEFSGPILSTAGRITSNEGAGSLNRAVTGLENLMGEAINVARDAAQSGQPDKVASLLNEATLALRQANSVHRTLSRPLKLSPTSSVHSSSDTEPGEISPNTSSRQSRQSREASAETLPTMFTKSSMQPLVVGHTSNPILPPRARSAVVADLPQHHRPSSPGESISRTPTRLYPAVSAESVVRDFAYGKSPRKYSARSNMRALYGAAASFYGDHGESVMTQPGIRRSFALTTKPLHGVPPTASYEDDCTGSVETFGRKQGSRVQTAGKAKAAPGSTLRSCGTVEPASIQEVRPTGDMRGGHLAHGPDNANALRSAYSSDSNVRQHNASAPEPPYPIPEKARPKASVANTQAPSLLSRNLSLKHPRRSHLSIQEEQGFSLGLYHKRQPIAREWNSKRKRLTAMIACLNTIFIGLIAGIYAGEVPRIQYQLGDQSHWVMFGNMLFFAGLGLSTFIFWPLPLLHGRKPYVLLAFGIVLPLQIPQAITVSSFHEPDRLYTVGLLLPRALTGSALGLANINFLPMLWDLYGASLMSERPHQEIVTYDDVRRQGGGIGVWLGIWTFCFTSSLSIGFCVGACIISRLEPSWGFYIIILLLAIFLPINVLTPETRRAPYRRSISHFFNEEDPEKIKRRVARGEVKLHVYNVGPKWWYEEVWAGLVLTKRMIFQPGFFVMMSYLGWIQAQLTLVILLLGALLSREYEWQSQWVGLAALAVPAGAILAMPLTKASWLSRDRSTPPRTDSMTFQSNFSWSTHLLRRIIFSLVLPLAGLAYCLTATGPPMHWIAVVLFAGLVGLLTDLGIAECVGIIMETFDTCDLQPGVNTKHRLQSLSENVQRRRTNYSAFPRVCAGFFAAQSLGFFLAAAATVAAGRVTNTYGTQTSIWIVAVILLIVTLLFMAVIWRWKKVQVIPDFSGSRPDTKAQNPSADDPEWRPVFIGNPSGKMRRMNILETGEWTRWTEMRKLNKLIRG